jgi:flagellar biosynthesis/type III secretory pathway protein FliH
MVSCLFSFPAIGRERKGFPSGIYDAAPVLTMGVVVVRALPPTRDTLLLRLLGAGQVLRRAIEELKALPDDARERLALPILVRCRLEVPADPSERTPDDEEFLMSTQDVLETWERKVKQEGRQEGHREGRREGHREGRREGRQEGVQRSLIAAYEARFGPMPEDLRSTVERTDNEATLEDWLRVVVARSASEITATLLRR